MRYSQTALLLATLAIGEAVAGPFKHSHFHSKKQVEPVAVQPALTKRGKGCSDSHATRLMEKMEFKSLGQNGESSETGVWFGNDGPYTNEFHNDSGEDLILVVWGPWGSWVNAHQPLITTSIDNGNSTTLSFASGQTGAWSAIYEDTVMSNGQVSNTWGEYTFSPSGVVDVSREPNMKGKKMSIVGPTCTSDFEKCVFVCNEGDVCMTNYELLNCGPGSQPGAQYGKHFGAPTGGCGGLAEKAHVDTYLM